MSKAILVIDMPKTCADCPVCCWSEETGLYNCLNGTKDEKCVDDYLLDDRLKKPIDCPLKPLPQKKENKIVLKGNLKEELKVYQCGWNDCIDEILGGKK